MTEQLIKRGVLESFNNSTYTATVLILEATSYVLNNVPIATSVDGTGAISGANCIVLFLDAQNPTDAVIIAVYGTAPAPPPGRVVFATPILQINNSVINSGSTSTFTLNGLPAGVLGIIFKAYFSSPTSAAYINIAPHGGAIGNYATLGNLPAANTFVNDNGIVSVDANAKIDIQANAGNCTVTLWSYGYIM